MNLNMIMDEVGARLADISGLRVFDYPPPTVVPPAGIVSYPERIHYDQTYGRGMTTVEGLPVIVIVGKATDRTARDTVASYVADTGALSVKTALEQGRDTLAWDDAQVVESSFDVLTIAGVDYIAAIFSVNFACQGGT